MKSFQSIPFSRSGAGASPWRLRMLATVCGLILGPRVSRVPIMHLQPQCRLSRAICNTKSLLSTREPRRQPASTPRRNAANSSWLPVFSPEASPPGRRRRWPAPRFWGQQTTGGPEPAIAALDVARKSRRVTRELGSEFIVRLACLRMMFQSAQQLNYENLFPRQGCLLVYQYPKPSSAEMKGCVRIGLR